MSAVAAEAGRATGQENGRLVVEGALTFATVPDVLPPSAAWIQQGSGDIQVDLNGVTRTDSAGLALLVEWLQLALARGRPIRFVHVPEQVQSLIRVNGLGAALGINNDG